MDGKVHKKCYILSVFFHSQIQKEPLVSVMISFLRLKFEKGKCAVNSVGDP